MSIRSGAMALIFCAATTATRAVHAQSSEGRSSFERGLAAADRGDWAGAIRELERARSIGPTASVHYNLAIAYRTTGRAAEAAGSLDAFFASAPETTGAELLRNARAQLAQLRARLCAITVHVEQRPTRITVDQRDVEPTAVRHWITEGAHRVSAINAAGVARTRVVHCTRGESLALDLRWLDTAATLTIEATPAAALVRIDGTPIGHGTVEEQLSPGDHRVEVSLAEHEDFARTVRLTNDPSQRLRVALRPQRHVTRSPWLWTGVAATVVGAVITTVVLATRLEPPFAGIAANVEALTWR